MSQVMSHREWMKLTDGGALAARSPALKLLDAALLNHEKQPDPASKQALVKALHGWINAQGIGWKTSIRNRRNAVETLFRQLGPEGGQVKPNRVALSHVRNESRAILTELFQGKKMVLRPGLMAKIAGNGTVGKMTTAWAGIGVVRHGRTLHKRQPHACAGRTGNAAPLERRGVRPQASQNTAR